MSDVQLKVEFARPWWCFRAQFDRGPARTLKDPHLDKRRAGPAQFEGGTWIKERDSMRLARMDAFAEVLECFFSLPSCRHRAPVCIQGRTEGVGVAAPVLLPILDL